MRYNFEVECPLCQCEFEVECEYEPGDTMGCGIMSMSIPGGMTADEIPPECPVCTATFSDEQKAALQKDADKKASDWTGADYD